MSGARELFARYLAQRAGVEPGEVVLGSGQTVGRSGGRGRQVESEAHPAGAPKQESMRLDRETARPPDRPTARWRRDLPPIPEDGIIVEAPQTTDLFARDPLAELDLAGLEATVASCTRCPLHKSRKNAVFGEGPPDADLMVVGEGPGQTEDETGRPFVGRAGQLLDEILAAIGRPRPTVYIANIVKSRPPGNRKPTPDETQACVPYLYRQIELIHPKVIVAMGATAAETLLGARGALATFRNRVHRFRGVPLIVTYHPAALLRNPHWKRPTWDDVRIARQLLER